MEIDEMLREMGLLRNAVALLASHAEVGLKTASQNLRAVRMLAESVYAKVEPGEPEQDVIVVAQMAQAALDSADEALRRLSALYDSERERAQAFVDCCIERTEAQSPEGDAAATEHSVTLH